MTEALIEILQIIATSSLMGTLLCVCWNGFMEFHYGQKSIEATFFLKVLFPIGACSCGWYYLLQYKDTVQSHFGTLSIALGILSGIATVNIAFTIWKYFKKQRGKP